MPRHPRPWLVGLALAATGAPLAGADQVEYHHLDAVGSVRAVTNPSGIAVERHDYRPYGEECATGACASNPGVGASQPRRFAGKERDAETGLDYFGARYYGAGVGRFTGIDPVQTWRANLVDPQRWNRYAYARNNPLRYVDPDGREVRVADARLQRAWDRVNQAPWVDLTVNRYKGAGRPDLVVQLGKVDQPNSQTLLVGQREIRAQFAATPSKGTDGETVLVSGVITIDASAADLLGNGGGDLDPAIVKLLAHELGHAEDAAVNIKSFLERKQTREDELEKSADAYRDTVVSRLPAETRPE